ncbi:DgyrCDS13664 [Dimorphilus gyrociliatus]|uniref:DgyrCDS13664 n=1 Tax=Dimorphilus gyrociliatus TaxID=2664684 RepID=A0A7I8WBD8_9ANNE|nr:DgyrCDS13664 [Dimorphilus gyrociliatus]
MKVLLSLTLISALFLNGKSISVTSDVCLQQANKISSWLENEVPKVLERVEYERFLFHLSQSIKFDILKDHNKLSEVVCKILNAETLFELSEEIIKYTKPRISAMEFSFAFERQCIYLRKFLNDYNFLTLVKNIRELLEYLRDNIVEKNLSDSERDDKIAELLTRLSSKFGHGWLYSLYESHIIDNLFNSPDVWEETDNVRAIAEEIIVKYSKHYDGFDWDNNNLEYLLIRSYNIAKYYSKNKINQMLQAVEKGFAIFEYFNKAGIFTRPKCSNVKTLDKIVAFINEYKDILPKHYPQEGLILEILSSPEHFKIVSCYMINSKDKQQFNNQLALYLYIPRPIIESYENKIVSYLLPSDFYIKSVNIAKDILSFIVKERPTNIQANEVKIFLDSLTKTYGENWLKYLDIFDYMGISNFNEANSQLAKVFLDSEKDDDFYSNLAEVMPENIVKVLRNIIVFQNPISWHDLVSIGKQVTDIYTDLENIGLIDLIKTPSKKCDSSKYRMIGRTLEYFEKNKSVLYNTIIPLFNKYLGYTIPGVSITQWISEFLCTLSESSEEDFELNLFGYLGNYDGYFFGNLISTICSISDETGDEHFTQAIDIWASVFRYYEILEVKKAKNIDEKAILAFVEDSLRNMTQTFGDNWTSKLDPTGNFAYQLQFNFWYNIETVAKALVESENVFEFNSKLAGFYYGSADNSIIVFDIVQRVVDYDWNAVIASVKEFANLLIEFKDTNIMKNLRQDFYRGLGLYLS